MSWFHVTCSRLHQHPPPPVNKDKISANWQRMLITKAASHTFYKHVNALWRELTATWEEFLNHIMFISTKSQWFYFGQTLHKTENIYNKSDTLISCKDEYKSKVKKDSRGRGRYQSWLLLYIRLTSYNRCGVYSMCGQHTACVDSKQRVWAAHSTCGQHTACVGSKQHVWAAPIAKCKIIIKNLTLEALLGKTRSKISSLCVPLLQALARGTGT